jgi:hypothetical protein
LSGVATWGKARMHSEVGFFPFLPEINISKSLGMSGPEEQNCRMGIPDCGVVGSELAL